MCTSDGKSLQKFQYQNNFNSKCERIFLWFLEIHKEFGIAEPNGARYSRKVEDFVRPNTQRA